MRSQQSFSKREKEKQRAQEKKNKQEKMEERKAGARKGKSLEEMMAYIDENGNISTTPPDPAKKKVFSQEDMVIGVPKQEDLPQEETIRKGRISFYNTAKGFGFVRDNESGESIFFHQNDIAEQVKEGDRLIFEIGSGPRGLVAINIKREA